MLTMKYLIEFPHHNVLEKMDMGQVICIANNTVK
jgi:hypothetical protein